MNAGFLINRNLCLYYWLKKKIGKESTYRVANVFERIILSFVEEEHMGEVEDDSLRILLA